MEVATAKTGKVSQTGSKGKQKKKQFSSVPKRTTKSSSRPTSSPPHYLTPTKASSFRRAIPTKVARRIAEETIAKTEKVEGSTDQQTKYAISISILADVFPHVPLRVHKSIFKACDHDIDRTMERIIRMYEDGVVGDDNNGDTEIPSIIGACAKDALDLFQTDHNSMGEDIGEMSAELNDLCEIFEDAHPFFVRGMLLAFNGDVNRVREELLANGFDPEKRRLVDLQKRNASSTMTYASLLKKGLKKKDLEMEGNQLYKDSSAAKVSDKKLLGENSVDGFKIVRRKKAPK